MKLFAVLLEGLHFLWTFRRAKAAYWKWRLGTLYRTFDESGNERPLKDLIKDLWKDRTHVPGFLLWRRQIRRKKT